jgi:hypothetical protein
MERKLTAIICAEVSGHSRLLGQDETPTLASLADCHCFERTGLEDRLETQQGKPGASPDLQTSPFLSGAR